MHGRLSAGLLRYECKHLLWAKGNCPPVRKQKLHMMRAKRMSEGIMVDVQASHQIVALMTICLQNTLEELAALKASAQADLAGEQAAHEATKSQLEASQLENKTFLEQVRICRHDTHA